MNKCNIGIEILVGINVIKTFSICFCRFIGCGYSYTTRLGARLEGASRACYCSSSNGRTASRGIYKIALKICNKVRVCAAASLCFRH